MEAEVKLGERIGIGRTADIFAWRPGEVIKLLRPGVTAPPPGC